MSDLSVIVNGLQQNVKKLIHLQTELRKENERLLKERNQLQRIADKNELTIKELEDRYKILKLAKSVNNKEENTKEIKHKINELVREIDKCVSILNR